MWYYICQGACLRYGLFLLLVVVSTSGLVADEPGVASHSSAKWREQFIDAMTPETKSAAVRGLFGSATPQQVQTLCFDVDDGVAIAAAWRRLEMQLASLHVGADRATNSIPVPQYLSREFLAFVEGRLRVPAPDMWTRNLLSSHSYRWGAILHPVLLNSPPLPEEIDQDEFVLVQKRSSLPLLTISLSAEHPYVQIQAAEWYEGQSASTRLPAEVVKMLNTQKTESVLNVAGIADATQVVLAMGDNNGPNGPGGKLISIAVRGEPRVLWQKTMDAYWSDFFQGSVWFSEMRMSRDASVLYVYHCTHDSIGIEGISLKNEKRLFSFNSKTTREEVP